MKRIGIYGGTFNPPHVGHVRAARYALEAVELDELLIVPSCISPHKQLPDHSGSPEQRLEMLRICFERDDRIRVSDIELQRSGTSYTFETVEQLKAELPDAELVLFMGTDMFLSFLNWRNPDRILKAASLGVFYRGERDEESAIDAQREIIESMGARVYLVKNPVTEISSTDLRRMLVFGCADEFLMPGVVQYIAEQNLYSMGDLRDLPEDKLEQAVTKLLKPKRVAHVLGCRDTAAAMAKHWGEDPTAAARAALLHDVTKALDGPHQLTLCKAYGIILDDFSTENPKTLHALTGSLVAERIFEENERVVSAIASHTTGKAGMNTLEKIIYVADYMEPNRDFPGVEELRELAFSDLDGALKLGLEMTLAVLKEEGKEISPESQQALDYLNKR